MQTDIILTRTERLAIAAERRRERVRNALAVDAGSCGDSTLDILATLEAELDAEGWDELDLAVRSDGPIGDIAGEFDSGVLDAQGIAATVLPN